MYKFCKGELNKFALLFIMSIWIAGNNLMKDYYHLKNIFTVN